MKIGAILSAILSDSKQPSSKRVCGFIGWFIFMACACYCVIFGKEAPDIVDTLAITSVSLLGLDSVVSIFRKS